MTERKNEIDGMNGASGGFLPAAKILAAGFGWGIIGVFSRPLSAAGLSAVQTTLVRCVIVAVEMGLLSVVFFNICYFMTIQRATLAAASMKKLQFRK